MYRYKEIKINKEDVISDLNKAVKETAKDLTGDFGELEPMYWLDNEIPVINSSAIAEQYNIQFAALATFLDGSAIIITDVLFNKYLTEDEQDAILAHELGHHEFKKNGVDKNTMSRVEWEMLADAFAVNVYGHERVLDALYKTAKISQLIYGDKIDMQEMKHRLVEIQMDKIKNK